MRLQNLADRLVVASNRTNVIAAGPLAKQPGTMPFRVVLVQYDDGKFSVHREMFGTLPANDQFAKSDLCSGHYFGAHELVEATKLFAEKVSDNANDLCTLYRDVA